MKTEVSVADYLPYGRVGSDGRRLAPSGDEIARRRRWASRVEGLAGSRVRRLLSGMGVGPNGPQRIDVEVEFDPVRRLSSTRKIRDGSQLAVELHVPDAVIETLSIDQAATYLQGFVGSVVAEKLAITPRLQLVEGGPFPLLAVVAVPRCGSAPRGTKTQTSMPS